MSPNDKLSKAIVELRFLDDRHLNSIIEYLNILEESLDKEFTVAARKSVFNSELHNDAVFKSGKYAGIEIVLEQFKKLRG